jgi:hypothetical protein
MKHATTGIKGWLVLAVLFTAATTVSWAQPVINGTNDGSGVWGTAKGTHATEGWNNAHAKELYVTYDASYVYFGALVTSRRWHNGVFAINFKSGGSSSDAWGRKVNYNHTNAPDLQLRFDFNGFSGSGYFEIKKWNGSAWATSSSGEGTSGGTYEQSFNSAVDNNNLQSDQWIEIRVPQSEFDGNLTADVQFLIVGNNTDNGSFSSIPDDTKQTDWNQTTNVNQYVTGITIGEAVADPINDAPSLSGPADGASNTSILPTLSWGSVSGATTYRVQVSTVSDFTTTVINTTSSLTSYTTTALSANTLYYWRVRGENTVNQGPYATARSFTTGSGTFTVYFNNPSGWNGVRIHYWGATGTTWPGTAMTAPASGDIWYSYVVPEGNTNMLFNNASAGANPSGADKTADLTRSTTGYYDGTTWYDEEPNATKAAGNWSSAATWGNGTIPGATARVAIKHNVTLDEYRTAGSVVIYSGATLDGGSATLSIGDGGSFTNNGTFTRSTSTVHFLFDGAVAGSTATSFYNLIVDGDSGDFGGVLVPNTATIHNKLTIASGGYLAATNGGAGITTNAALPEYASGATLAIEGSFTIDAASPYASGWGISGNKIPTNIELGAVGRVTFASDLADNKVIAGSLKLVSRRVSTNNKLTFLSDAYFDPTSVDSLDGNVIFQRTVTGSAGWRMLSAPTATTISDLMSGRWTQGFTGANTTGGTANVMTYNGTAYAAPSNLTDPIAAGSGIIAFIYADDVFGETGSFPKTLDVSGTRNAGDISVTLNSGDEAWTIVGNPYSTPIDADLLTRTEMQSTVYVWNTATSSYYSWNGTTGDLTDGRVSPFQSFWIRKSGAGGSALTIPTSSRVTTATTFRGKEAAAPTQLRLLAKGPDYENTTWLSFSDDGRNGIDNADAFELWPLSVKHAMLYTMAGEDALEINHLPLPSGRIEIPLAFEATDAGTFSLSLSESSIPSDWKVFVRDNVTGNKVDMTAGDGVFSFQHSAVSKAVSPEDVLRRSNPVAKAAASARFTVIVEPGNATSIGEERTLPVELALEQNYPNPFNPSTTVRFSLPAASNVKLAVYDLNGRMVDQLANGAMNAGRHTLTWNAAGRASGVYMLKLEADGKVFTRKMALLK